MRGKNIVDEFFLVLVLLLECFLLVGKLHSLASDHTGGFLGLTR